MFFGKLFVALFSFAIFLEDFVRQHIVSKMFRILGPRIVGSFQVEQVWRNMFFKTKSNSIFRTLFCSYCLSLYVLGPMFSENIFFENISFVQWCQKIFFAKCFPRNIDAEASQAEALWNAEANFQVADHFCSTMHVPLNNSPRINCEEYVASILINSYLIDGDNSCATQSIMWCNVR